MLHLKLSQVEHRRVESQKKKSSSKMRAFALLPVALICAVMMQLCAVVAAPSPAHSDHSSFTSLHSALLGSALLPFPLAFSQGDPSERANLDWLTAWLEERYATTRLLVEIAKRIDIDGVGRRVAGNGTSEQRN